MTETVVVTGDDDEGETSEALAVATGAALAESEHAQEDAAEAVAEAEAAKDVALVALDSSMEAISATAVIQQQNQAILAQLQEIGTAMVAGFTALAQGIDEANAEPEPEPEPPKPDTAPKGRRHPFAPPPDRKRR